MKKWLVVLLSIGAFLVVSCGGKDSASTGGTSGGGAGAASTAKPVVIEWLAYNNYAIPNPDSYVVQTVSDRYNAKFNFWDLGGSENPTDALNMKLATGNMPDIFRMMGGLDVGMMVEQGILAEIPLEVLKEKAPDYYAAVDKYRDYNVWEYKLHEGRNYGLPKLNMSGKYPTVLEWNKDWLEAIGYDAPPETLAEFEDVIYKFRNNDPDGNGKKDTYGLSETSFEAVMGAFGILTGNAVNPASNLAPAVTNGEIGISQIQPKAKEGLALLAKWYKDGVIDPEFITQENTGGYWALSQPFMNGRIGVTGKVMYYHYMPPMIANDDGGACYQEYKKINPDGETVTGPAPIGPYGDQGTTAWGIGGEAYGITTQAMADPAKMEILWKMINDPYADPEYSTLVTYGQEGIDYEMLDGVPVHLTTDFTTLEERGVVVFLHNVIQVSAPKTKAVRDYADKVAGFPAYVTFPLPAGDAQTKYSTVLNTMWKEAYIEIITGSKPVDYFDEFLVNFNNAGGAEFQAEIEQLYRDMQGE